MEPWGCPSFYVDRKYALDIVVEADIFIQLLALDYVYTGHPEAMGDLSSAVILEYDEYPLEIQCSSCFLQRFKLGFSSRRGEEYK